MLLRMRRHVRLGTSSLPHRLPLVTASAVCCLILSNVFVRQIPEPSSASFFRRQLRVGRTVRMECPLRERTGRAAIFVDEFDGDQRLQQFTAVTLLPEKGEYATP
jgi:hypothetical protein